MDLISFCLDLEVPGRIWSLVLGGFGGSCKDLDVSGGSDPHFWQDLEVPGRIWRLLSVF